jgi:hypothetical protein
MGTIQTDIERINKIKELGEDGREERRAQLGLGQCPEMDVCWSCNWAKKRAVSVVDFKHSFRESMRGIHDRLTWRPASLFMLGFSSITIASVIIWSM